MTNDLRNLYIEMLRRPFWTHIAKVTKHSDNSYEIIVEPHYSLDTGLYYVQHFWRLIPNE